MVRREVALDGGFALGPTTEQLEEPNPNGELYDASTPSH
jgi:hypothetical protein